MTEKALAVVVNLYWAAFWILNAADKLLNRTDLGLFTWYGKDRRDQFASYFDAMNLPATLIGPVLNFAFVWELAAGLLFLAALAVPGMVTAAFVVSVVTFIGFSAFDVICGDRAELLEHGTYLGVLIISWHVFANAGRSSPGEA